MKKITLLNGPNLNLLGVREPTEYGVSTLDDILSECLKFASKNGFALDSFQSNSEADLSSNQFGKNQSEVFNNSEPTATQVRIGMLFSRSHTFCEIISPIYSLGKIFVIKHSCQILPLNNLWLVRFRMYLVCIV